MSAGKFGTANEAARRRRDEEDTAAVLAVLLALSTAPPAPPASNGRTFWGDPAFTLGMVGPQRAGAWWSTGLPR